MYAKFKTIFVCLIVVLLSSDFFAQSAPFLVEVDETYISAEPGNDIIFEVHLTNLTSENLILYCVKDVYEIPENWSCSFCLDMCYSSEMDSIATSEDFYSEPLAPGETRLLTVDVFTDQTSIGTAQIDVHIGSDEYPEEDIFFRFIAETILTGIDDIASVLNYNLSQNYPNPFNPSTTINFQVPQAGNVQLKVFDILGNEVSDILDQYLPAGNYNVLFDAQNYSSGVYFYRIRTDKFTSMKKMILEK
ncbi:MAG: T9SS type A sorting domain-containing protein [bacterium]